MMDDIECGGIGGMIGRRNLITRRENQPHYRFVYHKSRMT
jgi:hypothetical protein